MTRNVWAALVAAMCACTGSSELEVRNGEPADVPLIPLTGFAVDQGRTATAVDPAMTIPAGEPFLPLLAGHRLAVRGQLAVVSDPEGDQADGRAPKVWIVSLDRNAARSITLPDGARPGAVELTATGGHALVLLEGSGGVAVIDTTSAKITGYFPVCRAPVDLALGSGFAWVACMNGEVVRVSGAANTRYQVAGVPTRLTTNGERVYVALADASVVEVYEGSMRPAVKVPQQNLTPTGHGTLVRRVANANSPRRLVPLKSGGVALLHQQSVEGELIDPQVPAASPYSGGPPAPTSCPTPATRDAVTTSDDLNVGFRPPVSTGTTLPIDLAVAPNGNAVAIADPGINRVVVLSSAARAAMGPTGCPKVETPMMAIPVTGVSSVAYDEAGLLTTLSGDTALAVRQFDMSGSILNQVILRPRDVPVGFTLFHSSPKPMSPTEPNVACASCHPAGLNNGGVLTVRGVSRKVMSLGSHLANATGVHWDNQPFQEAVIDGTWKTNMQGRALTATEATSLKAYVEQLRPPLPPTAPDDVVLAGKIAFGKASCGGCHDPSRAFTNNSQANVGRGMHRVPSLVGLAYSAPYMADGCAKTLEERFTRTACGGGEQHGHPALLSADELSALVAYLKTL